MTKTVTVHLRISAALKDKIAKAATEQRRTWSQMAMLMLEDAAASHDPDSASMWRYRPGGMPQPLRRKAAS